MIATACSSYQYLMLFYHIKAKRITRVFKDVIGDNAMPAALVGGVLTVGINWVSEYASPIIGLLGGTLGLIILFLTIKEKIRNLHTMDMDNEEREQRHDEWHKKHDKKQ